MDNRAEAIDILTKMSTNHFYGHREQEAFKLAAEALKQRWIPVIEKLPEKDGNYLVTYTDGGVAEVGSSLYIQRVDGTEPYWDYFSVTAWMPLPKPYKGSKEE